MQIDAKTAFRHYCIVSFVSEVPFLVAVVSLGNSIDQLEQGQSNGISEILLVVQILLTLVVIGVIIYIGKKSYKLIKDKSDNLNAIEEEKELENQEENVKTNQVDNYVV